MKDPKIVLVYEVLGAVTSESVPGMIHYDRSFSFFEKLKNARKEAKEKFYGKVVARVAVFKDGKHYLAKIEVDKEIDLK